MGGIAKQSNVGEFSNKHSNAPSCVKVAKFAHLDEEFCKTAAIGNQLRIAVT